MFAECHAIRLRRYADDPFELVTEVGGGLETDLAADGFDAVGCAFQ